MIVTLVGSVRFEEQFIEAQRELSRRGVLAFSLAVLPCHRKGGEDWEDGSYDKTMADLMYFYRIMNSDAILVLGDGYIGQSSSREILWAGILGKKMVAVWRIGLKKIVSTVHETNLYLSWDMIVDRLTDAIKSGGAEDSALLLELAKRTFQGDH